MNRSITFFHAANSRSTSTLALLEELGASYDLHVLDFKKNEQRDPAYLEINPMGKVPAIRHGDALVTEQPAVMMYLADLYPETGLAPAFDDPLRGQYLRWMVFYGSSFEPAVVDKGYNREPVEQKTCPYGDYDTMLATLTSQLRAGPYLLGERFSAADILWGTALGWTTAFKLVPELPEITDYIARVNARPGVQRAKALDEELTKAQS